MILANTTDPLTFGPRDVRSHTVKQFFSTDNHPWRDDKGFCSREIRLTDFWCHRSLKWPAKRHQEDCLNLWHIPSRSGTKAWDNINTRQKKNNPFSTSNFVKILMLEKVDIFRKVLRDKSRKAGSSRKAKHNIRIQRSAHSSQDTVRSWRHHGQGWNRGGWRGGLGGCGWKVTRLRDAWSGRVEVFVPQYW